MSDDPSARFGIAEWFGRRVQELSEEERRQFAEEARRSNPSLPCIPRSQEGNVQECTKEGGVCSIRLYDYDSGGAGGENDLPTAEPGDGPVVTLCPHRFTEEDKIYHWIGEVVLGEEDPEFVTEVPFLKRDRHPEYSNVWGDSSEGEENNDDSDDDVGRIDGILIDAAVEKVDLGGQEEKKTEDEADSASLAKRLKQEYSFNLSAELKDWCGLEIQSVYFSGDRMSLEYDPFTEVAPPKAPFPKGRRRPDFRSSSAKRLLPQLQTKIPSLRRWGKKMAVAVDEAFFYEMAEMEAVDHISNCDIVWVVVGYEREEGALRLRKQKIHFTTLEDAVLGLTAGKPVAQEQFEGRILKKLKAPYAEDHIEILNEQLDRLMLRRSGLKKSIRRYIDKMKNIRSNRAQQNRQLEAIDDEQKKAWLRKSIEMQDRQLASLGDRRGTVEAKEERLKERCKTIRNVRAQLNKGID